MIYGLRDGSEALIRDVDPSAWGDYRQLRAGLPSDLTDAQWERLEPLIPAAKSGGRPRTMDMRAAMNAIFYLLRTGCPWRYLPRGPFPPRSTVYNIWCVVTRVTNSVT